MSNLKRAELHLHTKASDNISVIDAEEIINNAQRHQLSAVAFTNLNNVQDFSAIAKIYKQSENKNLKVIYGAQVLYKNSEGVAPFAVTLLARNQAGIKELYKIISSMYNDGVCDLINFDVLKHNRENLLVGSSGNMGELYRAVANGKAEQIEKLAALYDYFEIHPTDDEAEKSVNRKIYTLGEKISVPVIASGNCHYIDAKDEICRRVMREVKGHKDANKKLYLHKTAEMLDEFSYLGQREAYKAVIDTPNTIADMTESAAPVPDGFHGVVCESAYEKIEKLAFDKAVQLYGDPLPQPVKQRLETELSFLKNDEYATWYLIAYKMVKYINDVGYHVGTRGAVGSVFVAFLLGISDENPLPPHYYCPDCHYFNFDTSESNGLDLPGENCPICNTPLKADGHNIPYETFMGISGSKMPDIDLKVPASIQHKAFDFLKEQFGEDRLARAGTMTVLLNKVSEEYISLYENQTDIAFTKEQRDHISEKISGIKRREGVHPAGVFILPEGAEFEDFTPLRQTENYPSIKRVTHLSFNSLYNTIWKFDVLGNPVPDMFKLLEEFTGKSAQDVPLKDPKIYSMFECADTLGIPEFCSDFMRVMLLKTKPKNFGDLVSIFGLSHGTDVWLYNGEVLIEKGHALKELPALRDDVFMQLQKFGVKRQDAFRISEFVRCGKLSIDNETTAELTDLMEREGVPQWYIQSLRKIHYMFPKAHAVVYVMDAIRLAWFKIYHPTAFYCAYLSAMGYTMSPDEYKSVLRKDAVVDSNDDCEWLAVFDALSKGIDFLPADPDRSSVDRFMPENGKIRIPLCAIDGDL